MGYVFILHFVMYCVYIYLIVCPCALLKFIEVNAVVAVCITLFFRDASIPLILRTCRV